MYLHARKASMYLRNLDFNLGNGAVQRRLLDLLRLPFSSKTWVKGSSIFSEESSVNRGILYKRLGWKNSLFLLLARRTRSSILKWRFGGGPDKSFYGNLDVRSVFSLYRFNKCSNRVTYSRRCFSSIPSLLKDKYNEKSRKFKNIFPLINSVENLQQAWFEIKSKSGNLSLGGDQESEIFDGLELDWFKEVSEKLNSGKYEYKLARRILSAFTQLY